MAGTLAKALAVILPRAFKQGGTSYTGTWTPSNQFGYLPYPSYRDHVQDIFTTRTALDARDLVKLLATQDPDVSAAFNAYLTIANTDLVFFARKPSGEIDANAMTLVQNIILQLTHEFDYDKKFVYKPSIKTISENMRYMLLLRGMITAEMILDQNFTPMEIRQSDPATYYWFEREPGKYKPEQHIAGEIIEIDVPSFFVAYYHRDPTTIYPVSPFVSAINTIAARQQVINDLYRIMKITGYPRLEIKVLEEVIRKNIPASINQDEEKTKRYINDRMVEISNTLSSLRPDQAFIHLDSVETSVINEKSPGMTLNIEPVIATLNAQNQAALKVMATIIGRGTSGTNTASVEARVFSMNCDELNLPVAEMWSNILTLAARLQGFEGYVECSFKPVELRPETELEPQLIIKSSRLKEDLSLGLISDMDYSLAMYGRPPLPSAPKLSGTGFMSQQTGSGAPDAVQAAGAGVAPSSGGDSMARSLAPGGSKSAKSNIVKKVPRNVK